MDNVIFYQPPSASTSQPPRLLGAFPASIVLGGSIAAIPVRQTASQHNQQNEIWKDDMIKYRDLSDPSQKRHSSDQRCRNNTVQEQATRNSPNSDDDDDLPDIDELLLGIKQKDIWASANLNRDDDDGFLDIDEFLSGIQQKSTSASAKPDSGGMAGKVDNGTRGDSLVDSSRSTVGSTQDPIILSDDESVGTESDTDLSSLDIDLTAKRDSDSPHVTDNELADGYGFGSGTTVISDRIVADHQDDDNNNNGVVDSAKLRLSADRPRSASSGHGSVTNQASKLQVNTDITQRSTNYVNLDVTKEVEYEGCDVFAEGNDDDDDDDDGTRSTKRSMLSTVSCNNPAFGSNISELQDGEHDYAQSPQLGPAVVSLHQSNLKNDHLPKHLRRRDVTRNVRRKHPRTTAPIGLASAASTVPAALESTNLEEPQSRALIAASDQEREIRDIDEEIVDDGSTDDSNDEDYGDMSDATGSKIRGRPRSRKRVRRTKDIGDNDMEAPSTHYLDVSDQAIAATSSGSMQESEEIPIHGYFTLKTIASKVVYCLTFSQELLPRPQDRGQRQDCTTGLEGPHSAAPVTDPNQQWAIRKIIGQKMVGCERHYRVEWKDTWMPESELAGAKELVDAFMTNDGGGTGGRKRPLKRCRPATGQRDARGGEEPKKRRGRPRKQK